MTKDELEALSRDAAKALPKDSIFGGRKLYPEGQLAFENVFGCLWLYESTEACTEIFSRILIPAGVFREVIEAVIFDKSGNEVMAFRIGTLTTLTGMKK